MNRGSSQSERRGFGRRESQIHAFVRVPGRTAEPCIVLNYSDRGALLAFSSQIVLPEKFRLCVEAKAIDVHCEVRRRNGRQLGVQFLDDGEAGSRFDDEPASNVPAQPAEEPRHPVARPQAPSGDVLVTVVTGDEMRRQLGGQVRQDGQPFAAYS